MFTVLTFHGWRADASAPTDGALGLGEVAMTPNERFLEFLEDIEPNATTKANSVSAHTRVRETLRADAEFGPHVQRVFLGGSYRRDTAIRPRQKNGALDRPDIDIYVVVDAAHHTTTPSAEIERLYAALDRARKTLGITRLKRNRVALAVSMSNADLDVCVLIPRQSDNLYRIGNRETGEWYRTDPEAHTEWSTDQNTRFSGRFKPMTKLVKWARRENPTGYTHPKSFAIEGFLTANLDETEAHYGRLFHALCATLVDTYLYHRLLETCPALDDPAVPGGNLLSNVDGAEFSAYFDKIKSHRDDASRALAEEDQSEATKHWRCIFGSRFPASASVAASTAEAHRHDFAARLQEPAGRTD